MRLQDSEARHRLFNQLVTLEDAAFLVAMTVFSLDEDLSVRARTRVADILSRMVTVYWLSEDRSTLTPLSAAERADGRIVEGGRALRFADGRPDRTNLVVTQSALGAAIERMRIGPTRV